MNLPALATDNITELLQKIVEFTQTRQKILIHNINGMHSGGFAPKDLAVEEFSRLIFLAVEEHSDRQRLVLCDGEHIKFGAGGSFEATPIIDEQAKAMFEEDRDEYLREQITKLLENSLNQRIAVELLKHKQTNEQCLGRYLN